MSPDDLEVIDCRVVIYLWGSRETEGEDKMSKASTTRRSQERKASGRMMRNIASKLYPADKRRNVTAIVAIAWSAMMVVIL